MEKEGRWFEPNIRQGRKRMCIPSEKEKEKK
jgi:hypothetical protein